MGEKKHSLSVLIAEDDPDDQYLFKSALMESGVTEIKFVNTGQQLLEHLFKSVVSGTEREHAVPDLIIADLKKPFFWLDAVKELRIYSQFSHIPVYLFSISNDIFLKKAALDEGASAFFQKPYTFHDLKRISREIVQSLRR